MTAGSRAAARGATISCDDCFFHKQGLCALELTEPCATFRPDQPDGLVPPSQLALLAREREAAAAALPLAGLQSPRQQQLTFAQAG